MVSWLSDGRKSHATCGRPEVMPATVANRKRASVSKAVDHRTPRRRSPTLCRCALGLAGPTAGACIGSLLLIVRAICLSK